MKRILSFLFFAILFVAVIFYWQTPTDNNVDVSDTPQLIYDKEAEIADVPLLLAIADTQEQRTRGLSGQKSLAKDQGLLFLFEKEGFYSIWMKDMLFSIDVLWFDQNNKVIFIYENFSPESFPTQINPPSPASMILELPAGFVQEHAVSVGDILSF